MIESFKDLLLGTSIYGLYGVFEGILGVLGVVKGVGVIWFV